MNVIVVDTSSWISYFNGDNCSHLDDLNLALREGRTYLPPVVAAELLSARMKPTEREEIVSFLKELPLCDSSFDHWRKVGELRAFCIQKGIQVSTPDAHIAQCCLDLDCYLLSEDGIFEKLSKITALKLL